MDHVLQDKVLMPISTGIVMNNTPQTGGPGFTRHRKYYDVMLEGNWVVLMDNEKKEESFE
ncbi:unnamed protein product [Dovyalis caffra]|uniref:Uncharacterized protein n=1 Tax=Dovyalis caffra TaxID=77055 RepID=A0AAV1RRS4_9ROSI|nr:unnamed protein product [Dovyalis caffra]